MIYEKYAFDEGAKEKFEHNKKERAKLLKRYRVADHLPNNPDDFDIIFRKKPERYHCLYFFHKKPDIPDIELALLCDDFYRLLFGYRRDSENGITVFMD